jgi:hypothetical protein
MPQANKGSKLLRIVELLYLSLVALAFCLLIASRTGEANTVWQVLHPAFIPTLFTAAFLLFTILLASETTTHKLLLIIAYSILVHSLFSIIFPAGDVSGQQMVLGQTRRVFDNTILHGLSGWPTASVQVFIVEAFEGMNLQAALTTIFARMLNVDIFYVHLFYIPILWGVFVPLASFLTTRAIGASEKAAVLSSLLISAFPYTVYFGAISIPNSLGFIFFFYSLYFMLKHLSSDDHRTAYWMVAFSLFSFLSHYLTGIMSFSLLLLTIAFKTVEGEKSPASNYSRILLISSFLTCVSLLPLSFIYLRYLGTSANPAFTLDKLYELPLLESLGTFLIGTLTYSFSLEAILLVIIGPLIGLCWMIYLLYRLKRDGNAGFRVQFYFLFAAFLTISIDYGILSLFMEGLPLNAERLWVLRDFIAVPFIALAVCAVVSSVHTFVRARPPQTTTVARLKVVSNGNDLHISARGLWLALNVLIPVLLSGWMTSSLSVAYPKVAPLQTTWYELEAAKYIKDNTAGNYVVIGDIWVVYAGEMIVGINNPHAYYFKEFDAQRQRLFTKMLNETSPQTMTEAMNQTGTDTTIAYFIVTEPRLGTEQFNHVVSKAKETLTVFHITGDGKLYVFSYRKEQV